MDLNFSGKKLEEKQKNSQTNFYEERYQVHRGRTYTKNEYFKIRETHNILKKLTEDIGDRYINYYNRWLNPQKKITSSIELNKKEKANYRNLSNLTTKLLKYYRKLINYMQYQNFIYFLEENGISKENINKISKKLFISNPVNDLKKFIYVNRKKIIPIKNEYDNYTAVTLEKALLKENKRKYSSLEEFFKKLEESQELLAPYETKQNLNESTKRAVDIYSQRLTKYRKINNFLSSKNNLEKEVYYELSRVMYDYEEIMKKINELSVLKYSMSSIYFSNIQLFDHSIKSRIEKVCASLEKEINKLTENLERRYNKAVLKLDDKNRSELYFSKKEDSLLKEKLEKIYQEILEKKEELRHTLDEKNRKAIMFSIDDKYEQMKVLLIKYPELNSSKYGINIEDKMENIKSFYELQSPEIKEAITYKIFKEYILWRKVQKEKDIISFQEYAKQEYNLELEVPEEFKYLYEESTRKKR